MHNNATSSPRDKKTSDFRHMGCRIDVSTDLHGTDPVARFRHALFRCEPHHALSISCRRYPLFVADLSLFIRLWQHMGLCRLLQASAAVARQIFLMFGRRWSRTPRWAVMPAWRIVTRHTCGTGRNLTRAMGNDGDTAGSKGKRRTNACGERWLALEKKEGSRTHD